jgi:hypothetical protein
MSAGAPIASIIVEATLDAKKTVQGLDLLRKEVQKTVAEFTILEHKLNDLSRITLVKPEQFQLTEGQVKATKWFNNLMMQYRKVAERNQELREQLQETTKTPALDQKDADALERIRGWLEDTGKRGVRKFSGELVTLKDSLSDIVKEDITKVFPGIDEKKIPSGVVKEWAKFNLLAYQGVDKIAKALPDILRTYYKIINEQGEIPNAMDEWIDRFRELPGGEKFIAGIMREIHTSMTKLKTEGFTKILDPLAKGELETRLTGARKELERFAAGRGIKERFEDGSRAVREMAAWNLILTQRTDKLNASLDPVVRRLVSIVDYGEELPTHFKLMLSKIEQMPNALAYVQERIKEIRRGADAVQIQALSRRETMILRWIGRDIMRLGFMVSAVATMITRYFAQATKASMWLEGAIEDISYAFEDIMATVGDIFAPFFEVIAEVVNVIADIAWEFPMVGWIGAIAIIAGGIVGLVGAIMTTVGGMMLLRFGAIELGKQFGWVSQETTSLSMAIWQLLKSVMSGKVFSIGFSTSLQEVSASLKGTTSDVKSATDQFVEAGGEIKQTKDEITNVTSKTKAFTSKLKGAVKNMFRLGAGMFGTYLLSSVLGEALVMLGDIASEVGEVFEGPIDFLGEFMSSVMETLEKLGPFGDAIKAVAGAFMVWAVLPGFMQNIIRSIIASIIKYIGAQAGIKVANMKTIDVAKKLFSLLRQNWASIPSIIWGGVKKAVAALTLYIGKLWTAITTQITLLSVTQRWALLAAGVATAAVTIAAAYNLIADSADSAHDAIGEAPSWGLVKSLEDVNAAMNEVRGENLFRGLNRIDSPGITNNRTSSQVTNYFYIYQTNYVNNEEDLVRVREETSRGIQERVSAM